MTNQRILGIDPSLTSTGIAIITDTTAPHVETYGRGPAGQDPTARYHRLHHTAHRVAQLLVQPTDLVIIERPAYDSRTGSQHDRSGLWWMIIQSCVYAGVRVVEVSPSTVKKYATGNGKPGKEEVLAAVVRRYPDAPVSNNNEADALVLALIGARLIGRPVDAPPKTHLDALKSLPTVHLEQAQGTA